ncbi:MAG: hypothetical protein WD825_15370 [Gemmatimonadaceae bacterium]
MSDINWNAEVRKLEREFVGLPPEPTPGELNARRTAERRVKERQDAVNARIGATARLILVSALAGALYFWPYARACGAGLFAYLGVEALIPAGALWIVAFTWRHRMVKAHGLALLMLAGGLVLLAAQVLPRIGYAKVDAAHPQQWWCAQPIR